MIKWLTDYVKWLHTRWPAGAVEKLPQVDENGVSNISGLYIVGDLTGIPLLKFSSDTGARAVHHIVADGDFQKERRAQPDDGVLDLAIVGAGVSGMAAALAARQAELRFEILEAAEPFSTVANFPKGKPIYTYPTDMTPAGSLQLSATVKEPLVEELKSQTLDQGIEPRLARVEKVQKQGDLFELTIPGGDPLRARRVIVAIGRSGNFRKLGVPGENLDKVSNRLHDPKDFSGKNVLVVGGGDSALETSIAVALAGGPGHPVLPQARVCPSQAREHRETAGAFRRSDGRRVRRYPFLREGDDFQRPIPRGGTAARRHKVDDGKFGAGNRRIGGGAQRY